MTTKTDEQERADFEALERKRKGFGGDTLTRAAYEPNDEYLLPLVQARWEGYQAGRAALQSQKPKPNDLMLSGVLRMPFDMAMASEISRLQFYHRAQQALDELDALQSQDREDDPLQAAANWLVNAANLTATQLAGNLFIGINRAQRLFDQARRAEGET